VRPSAARLRETTGPRHSRHSSARSARRPTGRSAGRSDGRSERRRPPATGSHRAPGTLPIESWLLLGKKRQQILLASLVAAALLLIGIPMRQQGIDAVDAAAARTVGVHIGKSKAKDKDSKPAHDAAAADPRTTSPAPKPSQSPSAKTPAAEVKLPANDLGPGHSLRTTGSKAISLTFDDGPDPVQTPKILALLAKYQIKATFCLIGSNVQKHPEVVREIVAAGHTLCNHTWNHSLTIGKDKPEQIQADLERTNAAIRAAVPGARIPFFRAPGGNFTDRLVGVAQGQGMSSLYWAVDPRDWDHPKGETDTAHVAQVIKEVRKVKPGSIILSHDFNQPDTIEAYSKLLPWLKSNFTITIPGMPAGHAPSAPGTTAPSTSPSATPPAGANPAVTPSAPADPAADS
jgi:peptidoglycan/xylan/chitin deacetylase (PgdA/CDA1 family)